MRVMRTLNREERELALRAQQRGELHQLVVTSTAWKPWKRPGRPMILRVDYFDFFNCVTEWVSLESENPNAVQMACDWWHAHRGNAPVPKAVLEALARKDELCPTREIHYFMSDGWPRVVYSEVGEQERVQ